MYLPSHFALTDLPAMLALATRHPFGLLCTNADVATAAPWASHLVFVPPATWQAAGQVLAEAGLETAPVPAEERANRLWHHRDVVDEQSWLDAEEQQQQEEKEGRVLTSVPLPDIIDSEGRLSHPLVMRTHLALSNPHSRQLLEAAQIQPGQPALAVFSSPSAFITATIYEAPDAPTVNYEAVQMQGYLRVHRDLNWLRQVVAATIQLNEPQQLPWYVQQVLRQPMGQAYLPHILGLELVVSQVQGISKLSQNRTENERAQIVQYLEQKGAAGHHIKTRMAGG